MMLVYALVICAQAAYVWVLLRRIQTTTKAQHDELVATKLALTAAVRERDAAKAEVLAFAGFTFDLGRGQTLRCHYVKDGQPRFISDMPRRVQ